MLKVIIASAIFAAIGTYTPLVRWEFQYGVFDAVVHYVQDSALSKVVTGLGSHEKITNTLTGTRSELVYGYQSKPEKRKENKVVPSE